MYACFMHHMHLYHADYIRLSANASHEALVFPHASASIVCPLCIIRPMYNSERQCNICNAMIRYQDIELQ